MIELAEGVLCPALILYDSFGHVEVRHGGQLSGLEMNHQKAVVAGDYAASLQSPWTIRPRPVGRTPG